ncbi:BamA/TamA family outer membrane protein [Labilibacter marinus]|uniref:BamA/TamA family outer membrane protein n=1 Tax=Labilibacter marinus TaxID=1477105 RepID=UPI00082E2CCF|nr:hypothetical protein [Labilibacter marinus]
MNTKKKYLIKHCAILVTVLFFGKIKAQQDTVRTEKVPGLLENVADLADWGMDLVTFEKEKYTFFFLPLMHYEERTKLSFGVMPVWRFYIGGKQEGSAYYRPSNIAPSVVYSTSGMYEVELLSEFYTPNNWRLKNRWVYQSMPDKFYHIGNETDKSEYSEFDVKKLEFIGDVMKGLNQELFVGLNYDVGFYEITDVQSDILNEDVLGYDGGTVAGFGPMVSYDSRNSVLFPDAGSFVSLSYTYYPESISEYNFSSFTLDARNFLKLGNKQSVLATQLYMKSAIGDVPFYRLPVLAGKRLFRGISHPYKYMDKNSLYLQAAYRSHLWWRLGYEVFTGAGNVFQKWNSDVFSKVHLMGGAGLRFRILEDEKLNFRFDYAVSSRGNSGFFFTLGEAF